MLLSTTTLHKATGKLLQDVSLPGPLQTLPNNALYRVSWRLARLDTVVDPGRPILELGIHAG